MHVGDHASIAQGCDANEAFHEGLFNLSAFCFGCRESIAIRSLGPCQQASAVEEGSKLEGGALCR